MAIVKALFGASAFALCVGAGFAANSQTYGLASLSVAAPYTYAYVDGVKDYEETQIAQTSLSGLKYLGDCINPYGRDYLGAPPKGTTITISNSYAGLPVALEGLFQYWINESIPGGNLADQAGGQAAIDYTLANYYGDASIIPTGMTSPAAVAAETYYLAHPGFDPNLRFASFNQYDTQVLQTDVPEPASWTLMLVGVGLMGASLRSKRSRTSPAEA